MRKFGLMEFVFRKLTILRETLDECSDDHDN
jgi:hypothetical protein